MTVDLRTRYLGLELRSPLVASASPLTGDPDTARQLQDAGAGAIVLPSLFEEEIVHEEIALDRSLNAGTEQFAEALDYFPSMGDFIGGGPGSGGPGAHRLGPGVGDHPARGQAQPVLLGVRELRGIGRRAGRRWAGAVQSLLPARSRP